MKATKHIIQKELLRVFGDRKLIFSLFILPAVVMIGIYSLMGQMMNNMVDDIEKHVASVYVKNAPEGFEEFVKSTGYTGDVILMNDDKAITKEEDGTQTELTEKEIKAGIKDGTIDLLVDFEGAFLEKVESYGKEGSIPEVKNFYNPSEDYSAQAKDSFVNVVINSYQKKLLQGRVGNLDDLIVFYVDKDPSASMIQDEEKAGGKTLAMLVPYLIVMLLFTGPMSLGIDAITGEKERGTMASMLITPVKRSEIVLGKILSLSILSCLSALVYAVSIIIAVPMMFKDIDGVMGAGTTFSLPQILQLLAIVLTLVYLYVAVVVSISVLAKSAKEAGTYVSPIYMVVIVAGMMTMFAGNSEVAIPMFGIPVYGSAVAIQKILTNELSMMQLGVNLAGTLVVALLLTFAITKAFQSEKVMFNA